MARAESINVKALLSPSLRISRPVAACSNCRKAKIKCDGKLPACTSCERSAKVDTCSGSKDEFARGKERSYVGALEHASKTLRRRVAQIQEAKEQQRVEMQSPPTQIMDPDRKWESQKKMPLSREKQKEASDIDHLVGDFGFLSLNATSRDFIGLNSTVSFAKMVLAISQLTELPPADTRSLPARYSISPLIKQYLDHDYVLLPFFSETKFMTSVSAVYAEAGRHARPMDHWMVRMVLAIVAANSSGQKHDANYRLAQQHVSAALGYADLVLHPGSTAGIQAFLLLVQYSLVDPDVFSARQLQGLACRLAVDLGLHSVESDHQLNPKQESRQMRRRIFYCVYALDRSISMAYEQPLSFTDDSVSVDPPILPPEGQSPSTATSNLFLRSLEPSSHLFEIRRLQSATYQEMFYSEAESWPESEAARFIKVALANYQIWFNGIPDNLLPSHLNLFRLEALYSKLLLLSPSARLPQSTKLYRTLIFEYAVDFAENLRPTTQTNDWHGPLIVIDVHRASKIGQLFIDTVWAGLDHIFTGPIPAFPPIIYETATDTPLPPSPTLSRPASALTNILRALRCLESIKTILAHSAARFGESCQALSATFSAAADPLILELKTRHATVSVTSGNPEPNFGRREPSPANLGLDAFPSQPSNSLGQNMLPMMAMPQGQASQVQTSLQQVSQPQIPQPQIPQPQVQPSQIPPSRHARLPQPQMPRYNFAEQPTEPPPLIHHSSDPGNVGPPPLLHHVSDPGSYLPYPYRQFGREGRDGDGGPY